MTQYRIYRMSFASVYPHYVVTAVKKGRSQADVDQIITWLTGYDDAGLAAMFYNEPDCETFFATAPPPNP